VRNDVIFVVYCGVFSAFVQVAEDDAVARKSTKDDEEDEFLLDY